MKSKPILLFATLLVASLVVPASVNAKLSSKKGPNNLVYKWGVDLYNSTLNETWVNDLVMNFTDKGVFEDSYSYDYDYVAYNSTLGRNVWKEVVTTSAFKEDYDMKMQQYMTGHQIIKTVLTINKVEVNHGKGLQLIWMAARNGTYDLEMEITDMSMVYNYSAVVNTTTTRVTTLYEETADGSKGAVITSWAEVEKEDRIDDFDYSDADMGMEMNMSYDISVEFVMPIIMSMQVFKTRNNETVAWADMFNEFLIYNDTNGDGIYTTNTPSGGGGPPQLDLYFSDEMVDNFNPMAMKGKMSMYMGYAIDLTAYNQGIMYQVQDLKSEINSPNDKTIAEIADSINFTAPTVEGNNIKWDILYPQMPMTCSVDGGTYSPPGNASLAMLSPMDFKYSFDYEVAPNKKTANLYTTADIGKISNASLYNDVQGLGLTIPHYAYFMSSQKINKTVQDARTRPEDAFGFNIGSIPVALVNMTVPQKENYTLYDYPKDGKNQVNKALGGTVAAMLTTGAEQGTGMSAMMNNPFMPMIFTLEDIVADNKDLADFTTLYIIFTQNYPVWSGRRLVHDPVFSVFFEPTGVESSIPGYGFVPMVVVVAVTVGVLSQKVRKLLRKRE